MDLKRTTSPLQLEWWAGGGSAVRSRVGDPRRLTRAFPCSPTQLLVSVQPTLVLRAEILASPGPASAGPSARQQPRAEHPPPPLKREKPRNLPPPGLRPESLPVFAAPLPRRPGPARLPFLTLSSSPPAEAVVTTDINAVVVAALSSPRPQLGPLNPHKPASPPRAGS